MKYILYTDDTQVHNSYCNLQNSLVSVQDSMYKIKLKLNPDKTEFLLIGKQNHLKYLNGSFPMDINSNNISPKPTARNLGVLLESDLNFISQINSVIKSCK